MTGNSSLWRECSVRHPSYYMAASDNIQASGMPSHFMLGTFGVLEKHVIEVRYPAYSHVKGQINSGRQP